MLVGNRVQLTQGLVRYHRVALVHQHRLHPAADAKAQVDLTDLHVAVEREPAPFRRLVQLPIGEAAACEGDQDQDHDQRARLECVPSIARVFG